MNNSIFVDSSLLVEYLKNSRADLLDVLRNEPSTQLYINQTVVSEYLFYHLGILGQKSPRTLKEIGAISGVLSAVDPQPFLSLFVYLTDSPAMLPLTIQFMSNYNLLPNDALILAACKHHGVPALASFDPDFSAACRGEGIQLVQSVADFQIFKSAT
ncbi:MAG: PIN domain-containing protein [Saprospiraceae bacterium]|nr:PIN domain-containing protein [Saprospiraceae bacterium]